MVNTQEAKRVLRVVFALVIILSGIFTLIAGPQTRDTGQIGLIMGGVALLMIGQGLQLLYLSES